MSNVEQTPEALSSGEILYQYQGLIYNRPCGRGICLIDTKPEDYLEYTVEGGHYYLEVIVRKLPDTYVSQP